MDNIKVVGAREHNLKDITVEIPREKLVVFTGISGSGKSSLAFDTIFAEGQRRYVESLSSYARQFLGILERPDVDRIEGLSPTISIDQRTSARNPRSTVGTTTEVYDYLRILFARVGRPHCPECGKPLQKLSRAELHADIEKTYVKKKTHVLVFAPMVEKKRGDHRVLLSQLARKGIKSIRLDGERMELPVKVNEVDANLTHTIEAVLFDQEVDPENLIAVNQFFQAVQKAIDLSKGFVRVGEKGGKEHTYSNRYSCLDCHITLPEIHPRLFSFNSPHGACPACQGLGVRMEVDPELVLPNPRLTLAEGAIRPWSRTTAHSTWYNTVLRDLAKRLHFHLDDEVGELPVKIRKVILYGDQEFEGVIPNLERRYRESDSDYLRGEIEKYMVEKICPVCTGQRLRREVLGITLAERSIVETSSLTIEQALAFFSSLVKQGLSPTELHIAVPLLKEIIARLRYLVDVGLGYLTLDRTTATLAGGEAQRVRLATQLGAGLQGVVYVLDEPSIGLHQRDQERLLETLTELRDLGNSVLVVEHDRQTIEAADYVIDIGPGAGDHGGEVVATGTPAQIARNPHSITGQYLSGKKRVPTFTPKPLPTESLEIVGARAFNLKNVSVKIPLGRFVCVTGVSGSGKSTLIFEILAKALRQRFWHAKTEPGEHEKIQGLEYINKVIDIDQSPIGRTPRSNPATYTSCFTLIREIFANTRDAKDRGFVSAKFSFNLRGGRCETCKGDGIIKIEMHLLPDVYVTCEDCQGRRYNEEVLAIRFNGKTIADILDMTVEEATKFFSEWEQLHDKLQVLINVGLGYMHLGQPATTLSGGEAQRVKLATELARHETGKTLYILDEPTTGLHFDDIGRLLKILHELVDRGNTVLVVEHNLDVVKSADWIVDLGPEGGDRGGQIVAQGTPEDIARSPKSSTGQFLRKTLKTTTPKRAKVSV